jgi:wyosine [tRNA(Phe)-imidazoG37] synthetase (radical SAM superfamily)
MRALLGVVVVAGSVNMNTGGNYSRAKQATQYVGINRGMRTIYDALRMRSSANMYKEEIRELSESFVSEAAPLVIEVEGETRRLTGTAESQYESWRKLLKEIYEAETGFAGDISLGVPARSAQPTS